MYSLPGYDAWLTTPPEDRWGHCPGCGCGQEDCEEIEDDLWSCPDCGTEFTDDEAFPDDGW